ncbi:hypothetical protein ERO13_A06G037850v2 [Gossypium hirsutum]|nr:hypothetical protein ERO13_A06G037850v2 [Gossypium hirsutum]
MEKRLYNATKNGDKNELICFLRQTPLHVAAMLGHYDFTDELLIQMPKLAKELDSRRRSPLHLAVGKGHRKIVIRLLEVNPDMCFICDIDGRNPLHIAAMKGRLAVLRELLEAGPWAALSPMAQGDTILHACVRWNQLGALKLLDEFAKDESLSDTIRSNILVSTREPDQPNAISEAKRSNVDWLKGKGHNLILVASLLADMAFHAAVNPPGGFWHDNDPSHRAGHSIFADTYPNTYTQFLMSNTFGFKASLIIIQLLISGLPIRRKLFKRVLIAVMFWTIFMILLFTARAVRLMIKIFKFVGNLIMRFIN